MPFRYSSARQEVLSTSLEINAGLEKVEGSIGRDVRVKPCFIFLLQFYCFANSDRSKTFRILPEDVKKMLEVWPKEKLRVLPSGYAPYSDC